MNYYRLIVSYYNNFSFNKIELLKEKLLDYEKKKNYYIMVLITCSVF